MTEHGRSILVVDDDPSFREFMELLLGDAGYVVHTVATVAQAMTALGSDPCDVVIADGFLPGSPPFAVIHCIRSDATLAALPIVLCSGAVLDLNALPEPLGGPHTSVLAKPFDIEELLDLIEGLLPRRD